MGELDSASVERLLADRAQRGYTILRLCCPTCMTPLVRGDNGITDKELKKTKVIVLKQADPSTDIHTLAAKASFGLEEEADIFHETSQDETDVNPVPGVPFCVSCQAHVVTSSTEIESLAELGEMTGAMERGSIIAAQR